MFPLYLLMPFPKQHAFLTSYIQSSLFHVIIWFFYYCLGVRIIFSGDKLQKSDRIRLMISNHPTSMDYIWLWFLQHHQCSTSNMRFVVNAQGWSFKILPLIGPIIEQIVHLFLFKNVKNATDRCMRAIKRTIAYFKKVKSRVTLVLYPEGGTLYEGSVSKSKSFAERYNKTPLNRLLLPREKGFTEIVKHAEIDSIYDVTLGTPEMGDGKLAYDMGLDKLVMKGIYPKTIHVHVRRFEVNAGNMDTFVDDEGNSPWLRKIWEDKEKLLESFYSKPVENRQFCDSADSEAIKFGKRKTGKLFFSCWFWSAGLVSILFCAFTVPLFAKVWVGYLIFSLCYSALQFYGILPCGLERIVIGLAGISAKDKIK